MGVNSGHHSASPTGPVRGARNVLPNRSRRVCPHRPVPVFRTDLIASPDRTCSSFLNGPDCVFRRDLFAFSDRTCSCVPTRPVRVYRTGPCPPRECAITPLVASADGTCSSFPTRPVRVFQPDPLLFSVWVLSSPGKRKQTSGVPGVLLFYSWVPGHGLHYVVFST